MRDSKELYCQVCLSCVRSLQYRKYLVFIATVTNFCHTVALFRYEQVLKSHSNFHQRHSCLIMKLLLQVQKHSRLERTSARQVYLFHTQWEFKVLYINMIKTVIKDMIIMQDQQNHTNVQHTMTTVIIIITASMIVSDIYAIMNFYSELTSGGQISELILLY